MKLQYTVIGILALAPSLDAQTTIDVETLLSQARAATEQFADRRVAVAAGYHRAGRDLPSMGEHWINPRLLLDTRFDVAKPAVLTYLVIDGRPKLTGVVYALPLAPGQSPPSPFGSDAAWHEHNGSIDDEALLPQHHSVASAVSGTRVAFLHAWIWIPSPEGKFSAENWAIPFIRAGIAVPERFPNGAARAISLLTGGKEFFADLVGTVAAPRVVEALRISAGLAARFVADARAERRELTVDELRQLDDEWKVGLQLIIDSAGEDVAAKVNGGSVAHHH